MADEVTVGKVTFDLHPWYRRPDLPPIEGAAPHRAPWETGFYIESLGVIYADEGRRVPVAVTDWDGCKARIRVSG